MGKRWNASDLDDDPLFRQATESWRKRFAQLLWDFDFTQTTFKDRLNINLAQHWYDAAPRITQSDVSEWQNIGTKKPGSEHLRRTLFPRLELLLHIAEVLDTSVGYLIGETEAQESDRAAAARYLGLSEERVMALRDLMDPKGERAFRIITAHKSRVLLTVLRTSEFDALLTKVTNMVLRNTHTKQPLRKAQLDRRSREQYHGERQELHRAFDELMDVVFATLF